jgi:uncharacterized membrane protein
MQLPDISIPFVLPFHVPLMLHPVIVHFAVVLPILVLLIELFNLVFKRRALSVTSLVLLLSAVVVYVAAYYTGKADGGEAWDMLSAEARSELGAHRLLGTYLVYALLIPLVFKILAMFVNQKWARGALIVTLVMFVSFLFKQGYDGGELVYKYGVNVAAVAQAQESLEDMTDELSDMNETIVEQEEELEALNKELETLKAEKEQGFGTKVNAVVNDAVDAVKEIFSDENATDANTSSAAPKADDAIKAVDANASEAI